MHLTHPQRLPGLLAALLAGALCVPAMCTAASEPPPTVEGARRFVAEVEARSAEIGTTNARLAWIQSTYITPDTQLLLADARKRAQALSVEWAREAARFDGLELDYDTARKLRFMKQGFVLPPPSDPAKNAALARLRTELPAAYSSYKYCRSDGECLDFEPMNKIMAESRDPDELLEMWLGWRALGPTLKDGYTELIGLANEGARELGFANAGEIWRLQYDMPPEAFVAELEKLIGQLSPLYEALHCHVRARLNQHYGDAVVPPNGPIPAHVLGNMWAQSWSNVYPLMGLAEGQDSYDLGAMIEERGIDELGMTRIAERFFTSMGFDPLPETFWSQSLFKRPADRDVVCHASAWHIDGQDDVRLKMCIQRNAEDFGTLHHELGHNYYQLAYADQDYLYQNGANDGFHEAVGDTLALSVGAGYLQQIGLLEALPDTDDEVAFLLESALEKVAVIPWTYLLDQWRWRVFSGEIPPERYTEAWWELRERYQGIAPPVPRGAEHFDPGAKYHVPASVPYTRYFLAQVLQFQFHRALCEAAGHTGPLTRCSIFGSQEAGQKLKSMLEMGASRPWPDALEALTGSREMDASAVLDYYAPLRAWLDEQNAGRQCGW